MDKKGAEMELRERSIPTQRAAKKRPTKRMIKLTPPG
jgi:hypothetical protein